MLRAVELSRPHQQQDLMRQALLAGDLRTDFQRIVDLGSGKVRGVQALVRWEHPECGLLDHEDFLPVVAQDPVADDLTRWLLHSALVAVRAWPGCSVSVRVTARDLARRGFVADVVRALTQSGIPPWRLTLELPQRAVLQHVDAACRVLELLHELGVGLALDDVGAGYSSLLYLRDLPVTELKIDLTRVTGADPRSDNLAILRTVAQLARSTGIRVVAVGVGTDLQAGIARSAGCHAGQGPLWGAPSRAREIDVDQVMALPAPVPVVPQQRGRVLRDLKSAQRVLELVEEGASLHTIAAALNAEGLRTPRKTRWTALAVARALAETP